MSDDVEPEYGTAEFFRYALGFQSNEGLCSSGLIRQLVAGANSRDLDRHAVLEEIGVLEDSSRSKNTDTKPAKTLGRGRLKGLWHKHYFQASFIQQNIARVCQAYVETWFQRKPLDSLTYFKLAYVSNSPTYASHWFDRRSRRNSKFDKFVANMQPNDSVPQDRKLDHIAYHIMISGLENRSRERGLTGEWIVFKKHDGRNYYLISSDENADAFSPSHAARAAARIRACQRSTKMTAGITLGSHREAEDQIAERIRPCSVEFSELASSLRHI